MRNRTNLLAIALGFGLAMMALTPAAHAELLRAGLQVWSPTGSASLEEVTSDGTVSSDVDDSSGIGFSAYGLFGIFGDVDAGLAIHHLGTVEHIRQDKTAFELGSQTDLNLRLAYSLPVPAVLISLHGEAGLTVFSSAGELPRLPIDQDPLTYQTADYANDESSSLGWNAGGGIQVGYSLLPLLNLFVGLDFQLYEFQLFKGTGLKDAPIDTITASSAGEIETTISGNRVRFCLGLEFNL